MLIPLMQGIMDFKFRSLLDHTAILDASVTLHDICVKFVMRDRQSRGIIVSDILQCFGRTAEVGCDVDTAFWHMI